MTQGLWSETTKKARNVKETIKEITEEEAVREESCFQVLFSLFSLLRQENIKASLYVGDNDAGKKKKTTDATVRTDNS